MEQNEDLKIFITQDAMHSDCARIELEKEALSIIKSLSDEQLLKILESCKQKSSPKMEKF